MRILILDIMKCLEVCKVNILWKLGKDIEKKRKEKTRVKAVSGVKIKLVFKCLFINIVLWPLTHQGHASLLRSKYLTG